MSIGALHEHAIQTTLRAHNPEVPLAVHFSANGQIVTHEEPVASSCRKADEAMARYAQGDDEAFLEVYDALASRIYGYLSRRTRDRALAEDLTQDTFKKLIEARNRFIPGALVYPWAFTIARNLLTDCIRKNAKHGQEVAIDVCRLLSAEPDAISHVHTGQRVQMIEQALARLPSRQRAAFELCRLEGPTLREAAQILDTTVAAVKQLLNRATRALQKDVTAQEASDG